MGSEEIGERLLVDRADFILHHLDALLSGTLLPDGQLGELRQTASLDARPGVFYRGVELAAVGRNVLRLRKLPDCQEPLCTRKYIDPRRMPNKTCIRPSIPQSNFVYFAHKCASWGHLFGPDPSRKPSSKSQPETSGERLAT